LAVTIRLSRAGRVHLPFYHIGVFDRRVRRDGKPIERLGFYAPGDAKERVRLDLERARYWVGVGAGVSPTVASFLKAAGFNLRDATARAKGARAAKIKARAKAKAKARPAPAPAAPADGGTPPPAAPKAKPAGPPARKAKVRSANSKAAAERKRKAKAP